MSLILRRLGALAPLALGLWLVATAPQSHAGATELTPETRARIQTTIEAERTAQSIPGLSAAVVAHRELVWSDGFGLADLENQVPATRETVYRLASISKPITAVLALQLAERGKLDLDAPVQTYVPSFPEKPWPVTTRQLLGHLGGIRHYNSPDELDSTRHYTDLTRPLDIFKDSPLAHEPGSKYLYTTYGYCLIGSVVEAVAGESFLTLAQKQIFEPAKMSRIRDDNVFAIIPHRAQGYLRNDDGTLRNSNLADTSNKIPGGGFCSTAEDLAKFAIAMQNDSLLRAKTREDAFTPQSTTEGRKTTYGLGWSIGQLNARKTVAHGGAQPRVSTLLFMLPEEGFAVALMANLEKADLKPLAEKIAALIVDGQATTPR